MWVEHYFYEEMYVNEQTLMVTSSMYDVWMMVAWKNDTPFLHAGFLKQEIEQFNSLHAG